MQFITTGNRIAVENFTIGDLYTITFTNGNYINSACIGIGANFVTFQRNEPELLFSLTMETAELVSTIDLYAAGSGTNNYNELQNKPAINSVELVGNKSLSDLGIQSEITAESPLSSALISGLGSAAAADTSDFATAAQGALADSAVQPADMSAALALKQDALSSAQLDAVNSGITSTDVEQITTNKNNILLIEQANGKKNYCQTNNVTFTGYNYVIYTDAISGDVVLYIDNITSTDSDATTNLVIFYDANNAQIAQRLCNRGQKVVYDNVALGTRELHHITLYSSDNYAHSAGETATYTNIMICSKAAYTAFPTYQPYAMSNAELTAAIQALQAQLANQ